VKKYKIVKYANNKFVIFSKRFWFNWWIQVSCAKWEYGQGYVGCYQIKYDSLDDAKKAMEGFIEDAKKCEKGKTIQ